MFRKFQKDHNILDRSDCKNIEQNTLKDGSENSLINLIGSKNVKRWRSLKIVLACKSDEEFVTMLLDIVQQYIYRNQRNHKNIGIRSTKETRKKSKIKNKITPTEKLTDETIETKKIENELLEKNMQLIKEKTKAEKGSNKIEMEIPLQNLNIDKKVNVNGNTEQTYNNLDIIRIKLCPLCNTHHIQDHCPVNLPQNIIKDAIDQEIWQLKYKDLYKNICENIKREINIEISTDEDSLQYSYAIMSLPECIFMDNTKKTRGPGVFAKETIPMFSQFGPLIGEEVKEMDIPEDINMKYLWEINAPNKNIYIKTDNVVSSNWTRFIRPALTKEDKNLTVIIKEEKLFFVSVKQIQDGQELLYWQDCPYSNNNSNKKNMEKTTCGGCNMIFSHPQYYRIHCSVFHDVRYSLTIKKYHCKVCGEAILGKENIMKHAVELHNGQGAYQCQFCKKICHDNKFVERTNNDHLRIGSLTIIYGIFPGKLSKLYLYVSDGLATNIVHDLSLKKYKINIINEHLLQYNISD